MEAPFLVSVASKRYDSTLCYYRQKTKRISIQHIALQLLGERPQQRCNCQHEPPSSQRVGEPGSADEEERRRPGLSKCWRCRWQDRGTRERRAAQPSFSAPHSAVSRWQAGRRTSFSGASNGDGLLTENLAQLPLMRNVFVFFPKQFAAMYFCPLRRVLRGTTRTFFFSLI